MSDATLPMLDAGEEATIAGIIGSGVGTKRLADLGFVRGTQIRMVRPGTPCIVRIEGACMGLGAAHQESIRLRRI